MDAGARAGTVDELEALFEPGPHDDPSPLRRLGWIAAIGLVGVLAAVAARSLLDGAARPAPPPGFALTVERVPAQADATPSVVRYEAEREARTRR